MFGLGDNDEDQKMWNLIILGFWGTDKEYESAAPFIAIAAIVIVVLLIIFL